MKQQYKNIKILIVEDDPGIREMYCTAFMREGFKVFSASDGRAALKKYANKQPDILLLDIMMPNVDGFHVLREVRKKHDQYIPVIMLTNLDVTHFNKKESLDHVDAYLIKSNFTPSEVVERTVDVMKVNKIL